MRNSVSAWCLKNASLAATFGSLLLLGTAHLSADTHQGRPPPYSLPLTVVHSLHSQHVQDTFQISIALPLAYGSGDDTRRFPVLFAPDADIGFAMATQIARLMEIRKEIRPFILVGIGYGDLSTALAKRSRDLTPTSTETLPACQGGKSCGEAAAFLRFIETELKPFVASRYPADIEDNAIFGFSLGGLFALHVLFDEPRTFEQYAIGSPALWWDDGVILAKEAAFDTSTGDLQARVFLSVGAEEPQEMVDRTLELSERLSQPRYAGLSLTTVTFAGETHASAPAVTVSRALREMFGTGGEDR